ncbi:hypothetical protein MAPG_10918 [Magnaporthiopsis poae ATCC 64411]|uniref:HNH nuclease domain-containing protein n=1 Tax=Magnaporthiopsis poae (strain ATCC 64411 / 73-15) TaxID=644358 RepID=A0A0C4EDV7_MAGP6|nr:hypothetical protein MAPG_10918 [Magnaporthiopsis poae ATCC 64411]
MSLFAREALPPPALPIDHHGTYRTVSIRHPAYPDSAPDLLQLSATDGDDWNGLDFDIARAACSVVTTVPWDEGILAVRAGAGAAPPLSAVERPPDGILREREYYWCRRLADGSIDPSLRTDKYPVYASFHHWRFPHAALPEPWCSLALPPYTPALGVVPIAGKQAALNRDGSCRVSASVDACELAHLIPYNEKYWFTSNRMQQYVQNPRAHIPIDDEKNLILLRRDLHFLFDRNRFVFVPKSPPSQDSSPRLPPAIAVHVLEPLGSVQLVYTYHNRLTQQPLRGISPEMLFARFAWALFRGDNMPFFSAQQEFAVRIWDEATGCAKDVTLSGKEVAVSARIFDPAGSRSVSPKKRALSPQDSEALDESDPDWDGENEDDESDDIEQWTRGRRRFRGPEVVQMPRLIGNATEPPSLDGSFATTSSATSLASVGTVPGDSAQNAHPPNTMKRIHEEDDGNRGEERLAKRQQEL